MSDRPSMKQDDHPDHNMPEPEHDGTVLPSQRSEGIARLRTQFQQEVAKNWMDASGKDAQTIEKLVRR